MSKVFGVCGENTAMTAAGAVITSKTTTPRAMQTADALDEWGDIDEREYYGGNITTEVQETYAIKGDITQADIPALGYHLFGTVPAVITSIEISTTNSDWPQVSITYTIIPAGSIDTEAVYTMPTFALEGKRKAQSLGITGLLCVQSASLSFSCEIAELLNCSGEPCKFGVSGGTWEATADFLDGTPVAALGGTLEEPGTVSLSNTDWGSTSAKVSGYLPITRANP